jgi:LAO/AO transport system kinase
VYQATASLDQPGRLLLPRLLLGITGAPGSGKSTLTDALIREYRRRFPDRRLGVVAVDPSSPFTGGAVLGDRVRMMRHATDAMVFVRSMASRGHLGGLALGLKGVVRILGLIGCDLVFIETVGVGQSEVEVAAVADLVMIVMAPGQGDSVQLLKAGLMEIGDLFVVNKADRPDAGRLHADLLGMLKIAQADAAGHHRTSPAPLDEEWAPLLTRRPGTIEEPKTFLVSAEQGQGIEALVNSLEEVAGQHAAEWQQRRLRTIEDELRDAVLEEAARRVREAFGPAGAHADPVKAILDGDLSVDEAATRLLEDAVRQAGAREE